jgi:cardiolipin synthase
MKNPFRAPRSSRWVGGNHFDLLENGEEFFPRVFKAIAEAQREVVLETFILFEDKIGQQLHAALLAAARRGAEVHVLVDGFGSPDLSDRFVGSLVAAGVKFRTFDPGRRFVGRRLNVLRRMHRKIVVVDGQLGFIGGINYSADHVADFGPDAKQDYAVQVRGPIVAQMQHFVREAVVEQSETNFRRVAGITGRAHAGTAHAIFVTRDNQQHTSDIEQHYRIALRSAQRRVVIANAYFFPGYRFIREIRRAAKRGVDVRLILQGQPDMPIVKTAAGLLYDHLQRAGVRVYEYCERPLHGKVALVDNEWSTVGSSNLDPLSLSLNLEANVVIRDRAFNAQLHRRLSHLIDHSCKQIDIAEPSRWDGLRLLRSYAIFHLLRWFPAWAGWLPRHQPTITLANPGEETASLQAGRPAT